MNTDRFKPNGGESMPGDSSPERKETLRLIGEIEDAGLRKYAADILVQVDDAIRTSDVVNVAIGSLATNLPNLFFQMMERVGVSMTEDDVTRFRSIQENLQMLLVKRMTELRPENTRKQIGQIHSVVERELKKGNAQALQWLSDHLDAEWNFIQREKEYPPERRDITDEGMEEIEKIITRARVQIQERRASWN